jgi:hypothetical protein
VKRAKTTKKIILTGKQLQSVANVVALSQHAKWMENPGQRSQGLRDQVLRYDYCLLRAG